MFKNLKARDFVGLMLIGTLLGTTIWFAMNANQKKIPAPFFEAESLSHSLHGEVMAYWQTPEIIVTKNGKEVFRTTCPDIEKPDIKLEPYGQYVLLFEKESEKVFLWDIETKSQIHLLPETKGVTKYTFELGGVEINAHLPSGVQVVYNTRSGERRLEFNNSTGYLKEWRSDGTEFIRKPKQEK